MDETNDSANLSNTLLALINSMVSGAFINRLQALTELRELTCPGKVSAIDEMIRYGTVEKCVECLRCEQYPPVQREAAWILINISAGTSKQTESVVNAGSIPILVKLLNSRIKSVTDNAISVLCNIAADNYSYKGLVLEAGTIKKLLQLVKSDITEKLMRNTVRLIYILCIFEEHPSRFETLKLCLPVLAKCLYTKDRELLLNTCRAIHNLTNSIALDITKIQEVINSGVVPKLISLLNSKDIEVTKISLSALGNIVTGSDLQTDLVIEYGILPHLVRLLKHPDLTIIKRCAWICSNICCGPEYQIKAIIKAKIFPLLIDILKNGDTKCQKEAIWAVRHVTLHGTPEQIIMLCKQAVLRPWCNLLRATEWEIVYQILKGLDSFLTIANQLGQRQRLAFMIEECGGLDHLKALQNHPEENVHDKALKILNDYFHDFPLL